MKPEQIIISMQTANRIFTRVQSRDQSVVLAVLRHSSEPPDRQRLDPVDDDTIPNLAQDDIPVLHADTPPPALERWIAVDTDTRGVLKMTGVGITDGARCTFEIITE